MKARYSKLKIFLICVLVIFALGLIIVPVIFLSKNSQPSSKILPDNYVINVVDGDTFDIASGERIRLICIDTPELGNEGSFEAKEFLESLILNKEVRLEKDISETDAYHRLLRYVYVNYSNSEIFVNRELVKQQYARIWRYTPDVRLCDEIEK